MSDLIDDVSIPEAVLLSGLSEADLQVLMQGFKVTADRIPYRVMVGAVVFAKMHRCGLSELRVAGFAAQEAARHADPEGDRMLLLALGTKTPRMTWLSAGDPRMPVVFAEAPHPFVTVHADRVARMVRDDLARLRGTPSRPRPVAVELH